MGHFDSSEQGRPGPIRRSAPPASARSHRCPESWSAPGSRSRGRHVPHRLLPVPARRRAADPRPGHAGPADRGGVAARPDRGPHLAAHAPDRHPDPAGPAGGRAARGGAAPGTAPRPRRGRPGAARDVVQPDGDQPPAPDPSARGAQPGPAPVRLRRLSRAAHPPDDRPARGLGAVRRTCRLRPADCPRGRAPAGRARPLRDLARRPARDQPLRRRCRRPRPRRRQPHRRRTPGGRQHPGAGQPTRHPRRRPCPADARASPRPTYAGWSGSCATWSPTRSTTPRAGRS